MEHRCTVVWIAVGLLCTVCFMSPYTEAATTVTLDRTAYFTSADGSVTPIAAGVYNANEREKRL